MAGATRKFIVPLCVALLLTIIAPATEASFANAETTQDDDGWVWALQDPGEEQARFSIYGVSALDARNVWAVAGSKILHHDGKEWSVQASPGSSALYSIHVLDYGNAWAVGEKGAIFRYDGSGWSAQTSGTTWSLRSVFALSDDNAWAVGDSGTILHYDGIKWSAQASGTTYNLQSVHALDSDNVWVVGETATILRYNGTSWLQEACPGNPHLYAVCAIGLDNVWAGGSQVILHYDGTEWLPEDVDVHSYAYCMGISAIDEMNVWVAGESGIIYYDGSGWSQQYDINTNPYDKKAPLLEIDVLDENNVWAVGFVGTILYGTKASPSTFYLAEGYTGEHFQEYLTLANPNPWIAAVQVTYILPQGEKPPVDYTIPANSRSTIDVNHELIERWGYSGDVSVKLESESLFLAERPMYFDYQGAWTGGHDVAGAASPATHWYFAEGYTGQGFEQYVCVLNPGETAANLTFNFQTQEMGEIVREGFSVPAKSRATFHVNEVLGTGYQNSLELISDQPVVAERPMYFDHAGTNNWHWTGGHCVMGATSLSKQFLFAEGTTRGGFEEWLTLQNPGDSEIIVKATYQLGQGQGEQVNKEYAVEGGMRYTVFVPDEVGAEKDVSVWLTCASEFMAERPMYFRYTGYGADWTGGHCVIGAQSTGTQWIFAEGCTVGDFHEWLCLQNPGDQGATVEITYLTQEVGQLPVKTVAIPAGMRVTLFVNDHAGADYQLSARVKVLSGPDIVVERPMYFNFRGWDGGHDVVGYVP